MIHRTTLIDAKQGHAAWVGLWQWIKPYLLDGKRLMVTVQPETRKLSQNAKFHAMCDDIAKSGATWAGKRRTAAQWKVLLVSGHAVVTGEGSDMLPGLEGEFVNLRESTANMSIARSSSLIEYTLAWCAANNVRLPVYDEETA